MLNSCCRCCCSFNFEFDFLQREGIYNRMFLEFSRLLFHFGLQRSLVYKKCRTEKKAVIKKLQRLQIIKNLLYSTNRRNRISLKNYSSEFIKNIELLEHASSRTEICPGWWTANGKNKILEVMLMIFNEMKNTTCWLFLYKCLWLDK